MNPDEVLNKLLEANKRFVDGEPSKKDFKAQRKAVIEGQKPYATIITCSDSRVVPEYIFDAGIGEIFTVINAGNICGKSVLGSIEYGVGHLKTPILIILGHSRCGAVTATCEATCESGDNIDHIIKKIKPATKGHDVEESIGENLKCVQREILENSKVVKELVEKDKLRVVKMKYFLETGEVKRVE